MTPLWEGDCQQESRLGSYFKTVKSDNNVRKIHSLIEDSAPTKLQVF